MRFLIDANLPRSIVVVFRFQDDVVAKEIVRLAEIFLREPKFVSQLSRHLAIVEPDRVRFRPALS